MVMSQQFISPTSNKECSAAQYIAEIVTRREATKKKIVLPDKWWSKPDWKSKFSRNMMAANSLLKIYEPLAILNALKRKGADWQWSLQHKDLHPFFQEEQQKLEFERKRLEKVVIAPINTETVVETRPSFGTESKRSKLD